MTSRYPIPPSSTELTIPAWDDAYAIGSELVDGQHRRLFDLMALLVEAERGRCERSMVDHAVNSLYGYIRFHFQDEERMMDELDYPDRDRHRQLHDRFILSFDDLVTGHREAPDFLPRLINFIQHWLVHHIAEEDTKIRAG